MKSYKNIKILAVIIFLLSGVLIGFGIYFNRLSTSKVIVGRTIDKINFLITNYVESGKEKLIRNNFTIESKIDVNINGENYNNSLSGETTSINENFSIPFTNLNDLEINAIVKQNIKDKKAYLNVESKIKEEDLISFKYLIDNSTQYYSVKGILDNYVNNGSCNYFESLDLENNTVDNMKYLYEFILNSLKNNLANEYFEKSVVDIDIFGKNKEANLSSIKIDDKIYKEILRGILKNLKEDSRANKILTSIDKDFNKTKIKDSVTYIEKDASYTVNIYTSKFLNEFLKLDLIYLDGDSKINVTYIGNESKGSVYFMKNNQVSYIIDCIFDDNKYEFRVKNSSQKEIGALKVKFNSYEKSLDFSSNYDNCEMDISYTSKYLDSNDKNSYSKEDKLEFSISRVNTGRYNGNISMISKISSSANISEDVSGAILDSTISLEKKTELNNKMFMIVGRLMGSL